MGKKCNSRALTCYSRRTSICSGIQEQGVSCRWSARSAKQVADTRIRKVTTRPSPNAQCWLDLLVLLSSRVSHRSSSFYKKLQSGPDTCCLFPVWYIGIHSTGGQTCPKHLVCNDSETSRREYDVQVDERTMREVYLRPFEQVIAQARPAAVMTAYNKIVGFRVHPLQLPALPLA